MPIVASTEPAKMMSPTIHHQMAQKILCFLARIGKVFLYNQEYIDNAFFLLGIVISIFIV